MSVLLNSFPAHVTSNLHIYIFFWSKNSIQNLHFVLLPPMARCRGETPLRLIMLKNALITPIWVLFLQTKKIKKYGFHLLSVLLDLSHIIIPWKTAHGIPFEVRHLPRERHHVGCWVGRGEIRPIAHLGEYCWHLSVSLTLRLVNQYRNARYANVIFKIGAPPISSKFWTWMCWGLLLLWRGKLSNWCGKIKPTVILSTSTGKHLKEQYFILKTD
jgi:hypothetical protein